jgi:hypothetical protein
LSATAEAAIATSVALGAPPELVEKAVKQKRAFGRRVIAERQDQRLEEARAAVAPETREAVLDALTPKETGSGPQA